MIAANATAPERDHDGLQGEAAEQRTVRRSDRLQYRKVPLTVEGRQVHDGADDDRRDEPQQMPHEID